MGMKSFRKSRCKGECKKIGVAHLKHGEVLGIGTRYCRDCEMYFYDMSMVRCVCCRKLTRGRPHSKTRRHYDKYGYDISIW